MKILICGDVDSQFNSLNFLLSSHEEVAMGFCLGNLGYYVNSSPIKLLLRTKLRFNIEESLEFNNQHKLFDKPVYSLIGSLDDPFIPNDEYNIKNLFRNWSGVTNFVTLSEDGKNSGSIAIGMLSGYYNEYNFREKNKKRLKQKRERNSNSLSKEDFNRMDNIKCDILMLHDFPVVFSIKPTGSSIENDSLNKLKYGCPYINRLIKTSNTKLIYSGHLREFFKTKFNNSLLIGLPPINKGYIIHDLYSSEITFYDLENNTKERLNNAI
jgi:hypothetical protein